MASFSDLPDELVRECLLRVPYKSHKNLIAVCPNWKDMLNSQKFYADRKLSGMSVQLICLIRRKKNGIYFVTVYDPLQGTWENIPPLNDPHSPGIPKFCYCVAVNRKLILLRGLHPDYVYRLLKTVYIYDFVSARWSRGADLPTFRSSFACAACSSSGRVYIAGGHDERGNILANSEFYDVAADKWEMMPPMTQKRDGCVGVVVEDKFMVISGSMTDEAGHLFETSAEVFDPRERSWKRLEDMWSLGPSRTLTVAASSSGELFAIHEELNIGFNEAEQEIMKYDREENVWTVVASPQHYSTYKRATQWRDRIFVSMGDFCYFFHPSTGYGYTFEVGGGEGDVVSVATLEI